MKIGIIKEGKNPPDKRVALAPVQCAALQQQYPGLKIKVQSSDVRCFSDQEYTRLGIEVTDDVSDCDVLLGVKEVPKQQLLAGKTYFFFSHTIKKQAYNRSLLQTVLQKKIRLIDYECLRYADGTRILGFGRFAGIVGAYNGLLAWGQRFKTFTLKPAHHCKDYAELLTQLPNLDLGPLRIALTGAGRVASGVLEIMKQAGIQQVSAEDFLSKIFVGPVYCQLGPKDYVKRKDGNAFELQNFYTHPEEYQTNFTRFLSKIDLLITGHYWDHRSPVFFTDFDMAHPDFTIRVVADISCDINGPIPCTVRSTTIENPIFCFNTDFFKEVDCNDPEVLTVMAVDNLPCELPRDASTAFGQDLMEKVLGELFQNESEVLLGASITIDGALNTPYAYLSDYVGDDLSVG